MFSPNSTAAVAEVGGNKTESEMMNAKKKVGLVAGEPDELDPLSSSDDEKEKAEEGKAMPNENNGG